MRSPANASSCSPQSTSSRRDGPGPGYSKTRTWSPCLRAPSWPTRMAERLHARGLAIGAAVVLIASGGSTPVAPSLRRRARAASGRRRRLGVEEALAAAVEHAVEARAVAVFAEGDDAFDDEVGAEVLDDVADLDRRRRALGGRLAAASSRRSTPRPRRLRAFCHSAYDAKPMPATRPRTRAPSRRTIASIRVGGVRRWSPVIARPRRCASRPRGDRAAGRELERRRRLPTPRCSTATFAS